VSRKVASTLGQRYAVPALTKAIGIIEILAESGSGLGVTEICHRTKLPKSTAFLILSTLETHSLVVKNEEGKYRLSIRLFHLGMQVLESQDLRRAALPIMQQLANQPSFTVHLASLDRHEVAYIEKVDGPGFLKFNTYVGLHSPVHLTAVGKALVAWLEEAHLDEILEAKGMPQKTPNTITTAWELKQQLETIRQQGYAIEDEEGEMGVRCIAAPIRNHHGEVVAALGITAHRTDLSANRFTEVGMLVKEKADQISRIIGANV
jgi:DNA-binding IclR family transcriptional regulator